MRQAAIIARAQTAASSRKDSLNASSRSGLVACRDRLSPWAATRHSSTTAHRLTPAAPPSMRRKLMALAACGISSRGRARMAPMFSEGRMSPNPTRPRIVQAVSSARPPGPMVGMSANDAASRASPALTIR